MLWQSLTPFNLTKRYRKKKLWSGILDLYAIEFRVLLDTCHGMDENVHGAKVQHLRYNVKHASGIIMVIVTRVLNVGIFMTGDIMISINKTNPNSFRYFVFLISVWNYIYLQIWQKKFVVNIQISYSVMSVKVYCTITVFKSAEK